MKNWIDLWRDFIFAERRWRSYKEFSKSTDADKPFHFLLSGTLKSMATQQMHLGERRSPPIGGIIIAIAVTAVFTGCAITPEPMTRDEQIVQLRTDREQMFLDQEPVAKPITLHEAMARAIKYNLDHRLKLMEEALSQRQLTLSNYDLLPRLTAAAGYESRDPYLASSSMNIATGTQSLAPSTSQDQHRRTADLALTWNVLDFGVSYFQAKQQADRTLIMKERRRKVVHSLMQQVRQAYWLALGAQQLDVQIELLLKDVESALADSRLIEKEKLRPPLDTLNYQRQLIDTLRQLEAIRDELAQAKPRLAALMNLEPGRPFNLVVPSGMPIPELKGTLAAMEEAALLNRPELVEARYGERISVLETRKAIARLLPGIELNLGGHYDSNSFLVDNRWADAGLRVSWNLMNIFSGSTAREVAQAQVDVAHKQRLALNMAVLSQVHVVYRDFLGRKRQYELAESLNTIDRNILEHTRNAKQANAQGKLTEIRVATSSLFSELRRYQSYGALQSTYGQLFATLGVDPLPEEVPGYDIAALTQAIAVAGKKDWQTESAPVATPKDKK